MHLLCMSLPANACARKATITQPRFDGFFYLTAYTTDKVQI